MRDTSQAIPLPSRPARGRKLALTLGFLAVLGGLTALKHWHNCRQVAHAKAIPQRTQAHFDIVNATRRVDRPMLRELIGAPTNQVRTAVDPNWATPGNTRWSLQSNDPAGQLYNFNDPAAVRSLQMWFVDGRLKEAFVLSPAFIDEPIRFWVMGELIRKWTGLFAAFAWLIAVVGAYKEPLFRGRLVVLALAAATVALAAWSLEPPPAIRDPGLRVPFGPFVAGAFFLLTLPAIRMHFRNKALVGKCPHCAYDLTGNVSGICPECGQPTPAEFIRRRKASAAQFASAFDFSASEDQAQEQARERPAVIG